MADRTVEINLLDGMHFESIGEDGVAVSMDSSADKGGAGVGWRPMELLLVALGSCAAMDIISILRKKRQDVTAYTVRVSGVQASDYPRVYTSIAMEHLFQGPDLSEDAVRRSIEVTEEKYCPVYCMLTKAADITSTFQIQPPPPPD
jgi:putative redox protein